MTRAEQYRAEAERVRQAYQDQMSAGDALVLGKDTVSEADQATADEHYGNAKLAHAKVDEWLSKAKMAEADDERGRFFDAQREVNALPKVEAASGVQRTSDLNDIPTVAQLTERKVQLALMQDGQPHDAAIAHKRWPVEGLFARAIRGRMRESNELRFMDADQQKAWTEYQAAAHRAEFALTPTQKADTDGLGGVLVPEYLTSQIHAASQPEGPFASDALVSVIPTGSIGAVKIPRFTDINTKNPKRIAEATDVTPDVAATDEVTLNPENFAIQMVLTDQLMQADVLGIEAFLVRRIGQNFGRNQNALFTNGTGTNQPKGITNIAAGRKASTAARATISETDVIGMLKLVSDSNILGRATTRAMAHQSTIFDLMTLRDGGNLVFPRSADGLRVMLPGGVEVIQNNAMSEGAATTGLNRIAVGDVADYTVARVGGLRFERERNLASFQWLVSWNTFMDGSPVIETNWAILLSGS